MKKYESTKTRNAEHWEYKRACKANGFEAKTPVQRKALRDAYDDLLREDVLKPENVQIWLGLGYLYVCKKFLRPFYKNGTLKQIVDWRTTFKLRIPHSDKPGKYVMIFRDLSEPVPHLSWMRPLDLKGLVSDRQPRFLKECFRRLEDETYSNKLITKQRKK